MPAPTGARGAGVSRCYALLPSLEVDLAERQPGEPLIDFAARSAWDADLREYEDFVLPTYVGPVSFMKVPWVPAPAEIRALGAGVAIVGARTTMA